MTDRTRFWIGSSRGAKVGPPIRQSRTQSTASRNDVVPDPFDPTNKGAQRQAHDLPDTFEIADGQTDDHAVSRVQGGMVSRLRKA